MTTETIKCEECGSKYFLRSSKMSNLCPECSHILYGYQNCIHVFQNNRCVNCYWDGSTSEYIRKLKQENKNDS